MVEVRAPAPASGLLTTRSPFAFVETRDRLMKAIAAHGFSVFARVDHAANATAAGLSLRPTELVVFGNPKGGTLLMLDRQTSGIDLPVKVLIWEDADGQTKLTTNDAGWLADRHEFSPATKPALEAMQRGVVAVILEATR